MKCDNCLNTKRIISENGLCAICCLSEKVAMDCIMGKKDQRVPTMITLIDKTESEEKNENIIDVLDKIRNEITMLDIFNRQNVIEIIDKYTKGERE